MFSYGSWALNCAELNLYATILVTSWLPFFHLNDARLTERPRFFTLNKSILSTWGGKTQSHLKQRSSVDHCAHAWVFDLWGLRIKPKRDVNLKVRALTGWFLPWLMDRVLRYQHSIHQPHFKVIVGHFQISAGALHCLTERPVAVKWSSFIIQQLNVIDLLPFVIMSNWIYEWKQWGENTIISAQMLENTLAASSAGKYAIHCIEFDVKRKANRKDQTASLDLIFNRPHPWYMIRIVDQESE